MSVKEAARALGLTPARVRALITDGSLHAERIGPVYVLDERVVDRFRQLDRPSHVRAMSPRIAWATAALADGRHPEWLRSDELSRLRARMSRNDAGPSTWGAQLGRLGSRTTFRAGPQQVSELLAHPSTARTGRSATNLSTDPLAGELGAAVWVRRDAELEELRASLGLLRSSAGNVTISVPSLPDLSTLGADGENAFRLVVAIDLLHEDDSRSRAAATHLIDTVVREARWAVTR